jgi:hypothetical protein
MLCFVAHLAREGIRMALMRTVIGNSAALRQQAINLSWTPSALLVLISSVFYVYCPVDVAGMSREVVLLYWFVPLCSIN